MYKNFETGRSMIEMLGVLAIIGVLSVGGIAGYSKSMEKFKVDKAVSEYSYLIQGLLEHITEIQNLSSAGETNQNYDIANVVFATNLVPETWVKGNDPISMRDACGNAINVFSRNQHLVIDMYLGGISKDEDGNGVSLSFSPKFCFSLMQNVVKPLSSALFRVFLTYGETFYGDNVCRHDIKCIRNLSLSEMKQTCDYCTKESGKPCGLILEF